MLHKAWSGIEEAPYCFSMSSVKSRGHTDRKIDDFDPNWAFPDCNSSYKSQMVAKWCAKLEVAGKWCSILFQGHLSNFKVTQAEKPTILTQIERFQTVPQGWIHRWLWNEVHAGSSKEEVPYCFPRSSVKLQGHRGKKMDNLAPIWAMTTPIWN